MNRKSVILPVLCLLLAAALPACSNTRRRAAVDPQRMLLSLKDTVYAREVSPEEGAARLRELLRLYPDRKSWEARRTCLRRGLLDALELRPSPERSALAPVYGRRHEFERYTVDNVAFECVPGVWVTGNLYRPVAAGGRQVPAPAVLLAHGHGRQQPLADCPRFSESVQRLSATLAAMGAVVFAYDMFAYGESAGHAGVRAHRTSLTQTIQTWSSLRAVDFLASLEYVDASRIGMTGASGGGTQTFLAAALDERIAVSVPVVQVSSFFPGGCPCESGRPIHAQCDVLSNNAEIAALAAPRAQLIISDGKDWTRTVDRVEYPYLQTVYGYYGEAARVENAHFPDEGHDYGYNKRAAACRFFADRLGLDLQAAVSGDGLIDESVATLLPADSLLVFPGGLPAGTLHRMEEICEAIVGGGTDVATAWPPVAVEAKPWTRWWWMGNAVDSAGITRQLEAFSSAGIGGVEITPIYGVKGEEAKYIDYLSPQWMKMLAFTLAEAQRLNMVVDMNGGTGWPFGGPEVSRDDAATKAVFRDSRPEIGKTGQLVKRAAPGGEGFVVDHLNRKAVERYFDKFDRAFAASGTPFPHSFFNDSYEVYGADWSPGLLDEFERRRGYRLQDYFAELLADGATDVSARVVADYRETVGDMLRDNFTQVWTDWAHRHGVTTRNQAHGSPANLIDLYALVDVPECESFGITDFDIPGLRRDTIRKTNDSDPTVLKYASSAAHLAGKPLTSAETFTWLTEHFRTSLSQCKPEIDLMFASGVNHVVFHGSAYSPEEAPWPGWKFYASVDMSPTNPFWRDAPAFFDYIARVQSFLQSGSPDNDFLLYLPICDIWHEQRGNYYLPFSIHGMSARLPEFCGAVNLIMDSGYDVDYISDRFLNTCTVENGSLKTEGGGLYRALILPAVKRMPVETLARIHALAQQGATVVFAGRMPDDVPGLAGLEERRRALAGLTERLRCEPSVITGTFDAPLLSCFEKRRESFVADRGGKLIRRRHAGGHLYFFAMLQDRPVDDWVTLGVSARSAVFYDPLTGRKGKARVRTRSGKTEVYMQLQPGESLILKTFADRDVDAADWICYRPTGRVTPLNGAWRMRFVESEPAVDEVFHLPELCSWTDLDNGTLKRNMGTALYETRFEFDRKAGREYRLCLGDVRESAAVRVNGQPAGTLFSVPFATNIGGLLRDGENVIEVEVTNLPANRIADYDRRGVEWRIFREINFVSITYRNTRFDSWDVMPSGLLGPVTLHELQAF